MTPLLQPKVAKVTIRRQCLWPEAFRVGRVHQVTEFGAGLFCNPLSQEARMAQEPTPLPWIGVAAEGAR